MERVPSKWDIIPIHTSDRSAFKACRRSWSYSSPAVRNLVRKANVYGINENFWFGTGIHHALEQYYKPGPIQADPVAAFIEWYELQWNGGIISKDQLAEFADRNPKPHPSITGAFLVEGLVDVLPDPYFDIDFKDLGIGMLTYYKEYAEKNDNFTVLDVEHEFSVPITYPDTEIFRALDTRIMPDDWEPKFGAPIHHVKNHDHPTRFGEWFKPVHARGRIDMIVQDNETGQYGLLDHKTANRIDEDYFRHLSLDDQVTTYVWAAQREAEIFDLPWKRIDFVIYQALRKAYPKSPTELKSGGPSLDRQKESTTAELFEKFIKERNLEFKFSHDDKMQSYYSYLVEMGDKLFIQRDVVRRNKFQVAALGERIFYEAQDMLDIIDKPEKHYPNPRKEYTCLNCFFRTPCEAKEMGYDHEGMIEDGYVSNYDR